MQFVIRIILFQKQILPNAVKQTVALMVIPELGNEPLIHPAAMVPHVFQFVCIVVSCVPPGGRNRTHRNVESKMLVSQTLPFGDVVKRVESLII